MIARSSSDPATAAAGHKPTASATCESSDMPSEYPREQAVNGNLEIMLRVIVTAVTIAPMTSTATTALPLLAGTWTLDPYHSGVNFKVRHLGLSNVRGRFNEFASTLDVGSDLASTSFGATIKVASIDTNNSDRD